MGKADYKRAAKSAGTTKHWGGKWASRKAAIFRRAAKRREVGSTRQQFKAETRNES